MSKKTPIREIGFGKYIAVNNRMLLPSGRFNVERNGTQLSDNLYFTLIELPWLRFLLLVFCVYLMLNVVFASGYFLIGHEQLTGTDKLSGAEAWLECFFFSSQTLTTVGYGRVAPTGLGANLLASLESFTGLLGFALISGLLYGRFSRPLANIIFSQNLLVAPFKEGQALMFRIANKGKSELINAHAELLIAFNETDANGTVSRAFRRLPLELDNVIFFSMSWTLVHSINDQSPLFGLDAQVLEAWNPEFLILIKAVEEANQQTVHARYSYVFEDLVWNARFKPMMAKGSSGQPLVLLDKLGDYEHVV